MKATFNEKQMQKDSLAALCGAIHKIGSKLIDLDIFDASTCPLELFEAVKEIALAEILTSMDGLTEDEIKNMSEKMTEKYTKIDIDGTSKTTDAKG